MVADLRCNFYQLFQWVDDLANSSHRDFPVIQSLHAVAAHSRGCNVVCLAIFEMHMPKDLYMEAHYRKKIGVAARSKRFRDVTKMAIERMEKALEAGEGRKSYVDYIQVTNKYLVPYFGNRRLDTIDYKGLKEFKLGELKEPSSMKALICICWRSRWVHPLR